MRRVIVTALCAAFFLFMRPAPAHAWWDWLDQLSGPGPFQGVDFQWRLICAQDESVYRIDSKDPGVSSLRSLASFDKGKARTFAAILGAGCVGPGQHHINPVSSLNFKVAKLWSTDNHLQYAGGAEGPTVHVWQFEPNFSTFVDEKRLLELTVGMGVSVLSGSGFDSMTRLYFRPVTLTLTPGGRRSRGGADDKPGLNDRLVRSLNMSAGIVYMPKGFDAENFGALPGTFHTDNEMLATFAISVDISRF